MNQLVMEFNWLTQEGNVLVLGHCIEGHCTGCRRKKG